MGRSHFARHTFFSLAALTLLLLSCGKTNLTAIEELKPQYASIRTKLATLVQHLADPSNDVPLKGLVYDEVNNSALTATILIPEQLSDPDVALRRDSAAYVKRFDPIAGGQLLVCLQWTGPKNPMAESALSSRNGAILKANCERAAEQTKFVVVVETVRSVVPTLVTDGQFVGGAADLRVSVIAFPTNRMLSQFDVFGQPDQVIKYALRPGDSKAVEAAVAVHSSMWVDARKKLFAGLTQRGATITLR